MLFGFLVGLVLIPRGNLSKLALLLSLDGLWLFFLFNLFVHILIIIIVEVMFLLRGWLL